MGMLSREFDDAVHLLATLGQSFPDAVRSDALAHELGANPSWVRRLVSRLSRAGLLTGRRGPGGGARLTRPPAAITLAEVLDVIEPNLLAARRREPRPEAWSRAAGVDRAMDEALETARAAVRTTLATVTVEELQGRRDTGREPAIAPPVRALRSVRTAGA